MPGRDGKAFLSTKDGQKSDIKAKLGKSNTQKQDDEEFLLKQAFSLHYDEPIPLELEAIREILENSWTTPNPQGVYDMLKEGATHFYPSFVKKISKVQLDKFEPYENEDILIKSQSNKGRWE